MSSESKSQQDRDVALDILQLLQERWPRVFPKSGSVLRPWKIGLLGDLSAILPDVDRRNLNVAMKIYQARHRYHYLIALAAGGARYDLAGSDAGVVAPGHQQWAQNALRSIENKQQAALIKCQVHEKVLRQAAHRERMRQQQEEALARNRTRDRKRVSAGRTTPHGHGRA